MIIRHIPMKAKSRSSFAGLVRYITHAQNKQERVGKISISHCVSNDLDWAIHEVNATLNQNQRA